MNEYLRSFVNDQKDDWDDWMKFYSFTYNTTPHTDHGFTPHELSNKGVEPVYNLDTYYHELKFKIQKSNQIAKQNLVQHKINRTNQYKSRSSAIQIKTNDKVYITIYKIDEKSRKFTLDHSRLLKLQIRTAKFKT